MTGRKSTGKDISSALKKHPAKIKVKQKKTHSNKEADQRMKVKKKKKKGGRSTRMKDTLCHSLCQYLDILSLTDHIPA